MHVVLVVFGGTNTPESLTLANRMQPRKASYLPSSCLSSPEQEPDRFSARTQKAIGSQQECDAPGPSIGIGRLCLCPSFAAIVRIQMLSQSHVWIAYQCPCEFLLEAFANPHMLCAASAESHAQLPLLCYNSSLIGRLVAETSLG